MRWRARIDALKERIVTNNQYANVLEMMENKLKTK